MPLREERGRPTFSGKDPRELKRYFKELEECFTRNGVTDETKKKQWACFYPPVSTVEDWELIPEYADVNKTYDEFVKAIKNLYPGADDENRFTRADLNLHIDSWRRHGIVTLGDWAEYFRTYKTMTTWLILKGRMGAYDQGTLILHQTL